MARAFCTLCMDYHAQGEHFEDVLAHTRVYALDGVGELESGDSLYMIGAVVEEGRLLRVDARGRLLVSISVERTNYSNDTTHETKLVVVLCRAPMTKAACVRRSTTGWIGGRVVENRVEELVGEQAQILIDHMEGKR